jgi:hypothetical protein
LRFKYAEAILNNFPKALNFRVKVLYFR